MNDNSKELAKPRLMEELLPLEDFEPEADLPSEGIENISEISPIELQRQKHRLFEEWPKFSGVEMPQDIDPDKLSDQELVAALYENLTAGVDKVIQDIGFKIDQEKLEGIDKEEDVAKKTELQQEFINQILQQTRGTAVGGLFNRGKEDTWAFFPKQIAESRRLNCSGATLVIGRILEQAGFNVEHGFAAHHALSVVELADGRKYYVDSRRNKDNIVALGQEKKPIGDFIYRDLDNPRIAYKKIISVPREWSEVAIVMSNYNAMRNEVSKHRPDNAARQEAARLIEKMDDSLKDIDFGMLWDELFPEVQKLHMENQQWMEEEKIVSAKHNFSDQIENAVSSRFAGLNQDQRAAVTNELINHGQEILAFCQNIDYSAVSDLQNRLSTDAYEVAIIMRDTLEDIRGHSQAAYEFALEELKAKF